MHLESRALSVNGSTSSGVPAIKFPTRFTRLQQARTLFLLGWGQSKPLCWEIPMRWFGPNAASPPESAFATSVGFHEEAKCHVHP